MTVEEMNKEKKADIIREVRRLAEKEDIDAAVAKNTELKLPFHAEHEKCLVIAMIRADRIEEAAELANDLQTPNFNNFISRTAFLENWFIEQMYIAGKLPMNDLETTNKNLELICQYFVWKEIKKTLFAFIEELNTDNCQKITAGILAYQEPPREE